MRNEDIRLTENPSLYMLICSYKSLSHACPVVMRNEDIRLSVLVHASAVDKSLSFTANMRNEDIRLTEEYPSLYMPICIVISHYHSLTANMRNEDIRLTEEYPSFYMLIHSYKSLSFTAR